MSETAPAPRIPKPAWLRVRAPTSPAFAETRRLMRAKGLTTVCEEAACPNIGECWSQKHATVMILGDTCTRACAFCNVKTGMPQPVDLLEPEHLAEAAAEAGARVTLISGPVFLQTPDRVERINVVSALDMLQACEASMPCDLLIAAAAVADYRPQLIAEHKLKKDPANGDGLLLELVRNPDILATLAGRSDRPFSVGFAAETQNLLDYAARKLRDKNLDLIVANDVANPSIGFNSEDNAITVIDRALQPTSFAQTSKAKIARQLITFIADRLKQN